MGILRDSPSTVSYPTLDPFEICDDVTLDLPVSSTASVAVTSPVTVSSSRDSVNHKHVKRKTQLKNRNVPVKVSFLKRIRAARNYVALCFLLIGVVTVLGALKPWSYFSQPNLVFAYFEVRALDANGHPIAGAVVKNAGKRVGTTDSFGEWRRYMQVSLGSTIPISLTKKTPNQLLFVSRNFAVPPVKPEKNEIELRSSVQLMPAESTTVDTDVGSSVRTPESPSATIVQTPEAKPMTIPHEAASPLVVSDLESIWFAASDARTDKELVPALVSRAKELGLKVEKNAAWQVQLTNLIDKPAKIAKDGGGLIMVSSTASQGSMQPSVEFLRNYQFDTRATARGILFGLINHLNKNVLLTRAKGHWAAVLPKNSPQIWQLSANQMLYGTTSQVKLGDERYADEMVQGFFLREQKEAPCAQSMTSCYAKTSSILDTPPVAGWRRLKLVTPAIVKDSVKVFVSGYSAKALGNNVFEYWGQERAKANVTILQNGRLVLRGAVTGSSSVAAIVGHTSLSRR